MDFLIERPDGSRVIGTTGLKPLVGYSKLLGPNSIIFLPDWLPGQPYRQGDLRLSGGMAGDQPALNMAGRYKVKVGFYGQQGHPIPYSYTVTCRVAACNGTVLYSKSGMIEPGPPQDAGSFVLPDQPADTPSSDESDMRGKKS